MPKKVVIVEDNELNLKLFRDLLLSNKIDAYDIKDGNIAIEKVREIKPDLIIMDIQLRGASGMDIIKKIKSDDTINNIPIIAVTAFVLEQDKEEIMSAGCEAYISKPISIGPFMEEVNNLLEKK